MDVPAREPPPKVEILPADTPPARRIALLHPIKHQKTLLICLFIGTAHWFAQELVFFAHRLQYRFWNKNVFATALAEVHVHWMWVTCCRLHEARCRLKETGIISS